ncbi:MAG: NAD(P)/FAD-dependent oxidoreductase [Chloroflexota bacterium]|nr:NAD(P)/FAD-dependent oxidoreductase [Chloroflexota bacterium]
MKTTDVVVVGGGPGGLAVSQQLTACNIPHVVLERGDHPAWMWDHVYDSLRLHTGKHLSSLPGMSFPSNTSLFPTRSEFTAYLHYYAEKSKLPVHTGIEATGLRREKESWFVETSGTHYRARIVVVATGIMSSPFLPAFTGMEVYGGQLFHSTEYRRPETCPGQSILVIGIGNSAAEIASELAASGREVTVSVRSGAAVIPRTIAGIPSQYFGWGISWLPGSVQRQVVQSTARLGGLLHRRQATLPRKGDAGPCQDVPVVGHTIVNHITAGRIKLRPGIADFPEDTVRFNDRSAWQGDTVVLATGYRSAIEWMGEYGARDGCGFALRKDRVRSAHHDGLYFVGHNYDGRGGLYNIRIDAKRIARQVARNLRKMKVGESP